ncbi:Prosaposin [Exaiptasia diaphana]|nr:Prosaposin [Exaiptasia diaphana]
MKTLKSNGEICDICTTVLTYFKNLLQDNTTEGEIVDGLKELCGYLPEQIKSQCTAAVSQYGMALLKLIASSDPKTLCSDVGLCTSKVKKIHDAALKDKCYFGVSYWCASHANAIACKKTAYCLKYGWLQKQ